MKKPFSKLIPVADLCLLPLIYPSAWLLKFLRENGVSRFPQCKKALLNTGVFPIRNHYYEPQFDYRDRKTTLSKERYLPGIDWNIEGQLALLSTFTFAEELTSIPMQKKGELDFHLDNPAFKSGDAEYWYQLIRSKRPRRIYEVGSGHSTLLAIAAVRKNHETNPDYLCEHVCIEPYEAPWLEQAGVRVIREKIEDFDPSFFSVLQEDDILFIDSSHIIRPEGDVVFEYLQLLPTLSKGVIVHIHDIFSPRNYLQKWIEEDVLFWNEQYLLEAFMSHNRSWEIIGALNFLHHNCYDELKRTAPFLTPEREPGSFYIRKTR